MLWLSFCHSLHLWWGQVTCPRASVEIRFFIDVLLNNYMPQRYRYPGRIIVVTFTLERNFSSSFGVRRSYHTCLLCLLYLFQLLCFGLRFFWDFLNVQYHCMIAVWARKTSSPETLFSSSMDLYSSLLVRCRLSLDVASSSAFFFFLKKLLFMRSLNSAITSVMSSPILLPSSSGRNFPTFLDRCSCIFFPIVALRCPSISSFIFKERKLQASFSSSRYCIYSFSSVFCGSRGNNILQPCILAIIQVVAFLSDTTAKSMTLTFTGS